MDVILVPTDGSDHACKAVELAADLAQKYEAKLVVMHVMSPSWQERVPEELRSYAHSEHMDETQRGIMDSVGRQILRRAETAAREQGLEDVETLLEVGDVAARVLAAAKGQGADLIVMGSRGLGDLAGLLQGSVSHKVTAHAHCSCITVK